MSQAKNHLSLLPKIKFLLSNKIKVDGKIDIILEKVSNLKKTVTRLETLIVDLIKRVGNVAGLISHLSL